MKNWLKIFYEFLVVQTTPGKINNKISGGLAPKTLKETQFESFFFVDGSKIIINRG